MRSLAEWPELEIRQAGRGIFVRVRSAWFADWWSAPETWAGEPMDALYDWLDEERDAARR